jgi:SAM-dependent methyltransferase
MSKPSPRLIPWRVSGPNKQMMDVFVTMGVNPPVSVMDLGCGAGKNAKYLSERGFNVVGVDFSVEALKLARTLKVTLPLRAIVYGNSLTYHKILFRDLFIHVDLENLTLPQHRSAWKNETHKWARNNYVKIIDFLKMCEDNVQI